MTQGSIGRYEASWGEYGADEWSDAMVASMKLGGVDNLFFVSGSEIAFWQESVAKANEREWPAPRLITVTHEGVALNAAAGDAMVSGHPSATAVHVDVGTLNYGAAIHTAWRGSYPVLMTAGTGPRAFPGSMIGGREGGVQWVQEPRDQGEIVRQYTKVDHRLEHQDNPGLMISRLLQVAMSEPKGPVYLTVPRETAMLPMPGSTRFPTLNLMGVARAAWPDPADARRAAEWLIKADNPLLCLAKSGRNPESVEHIVRLAELLALPVAENHTDRLNFPTTHSLFGTGPASKDADALLIIESPIPFNPGPDSPLRLQDRVGGRGPRLFPLQDHGASSRPVAAGISIGSGPSHLRSCDQYANRHRHVPHRRPASAVGGSKARARSCRRGCGDEGGATQAPAPPMGRLPAGPDPGTGYGPAGRCIEQRSLCSGLP